MLFHFKLFRAKNLSKIIDLTDEYVFNGDLEKIIEVTYSYRETEDWYLINETLFEEFLWIEYGWHDIDTLWRKCKYKLWVQLILIDDIIKKVYKIKMTSRSKKLRRDIFIEALEYVKTILSIALEWIDFELEKAWRPHKFTKTKTNRKIKTIERLEKQAFWPKVIENTEEFSRCYNFISSNHNLKKERLEKKDIKSMNKYLKTIKASTKSEIIETLDIKKKKWKWKFLKQEISRSEYRKIFDTVCEFYGLPQRTKLTSAWSIYDGDKFLEIPRNPTYAYFTLERILKLLTHEIESHYINAYNWKLLLWNFRGAKNLPKEEWLAMFMEKIFVWHNYDDIDNIVEYFFAVMAGEVLEWKDFKDFMRIMWKEYKCKRNHSSSFIRAKRNYPFGYPWVQHKDVVYFRWLTDIINYLKSGWEFRKLFLWKVGFHDLEHLSDIYERYEEKSDIVFPIFISDLIYYYLFEIQKDAIFVFNSQKYYLYLKKKYWFLDLDAFKIIEQIDTKWKKVEKILNIFERVIK